MQCVNHQVFKDVELLQHNIECVTRHIREKLEKAHETDIDRKVLRFVPTAEGKTYYFDGERYWRVCVFIPESQTLEAVTPESSYLVGVKFGEFEAMLADLPEKLGETIPDFHNMEFRMQQLREAVAVTGGKQYNVSEGDTLFIEKLDVNAGDSVVFDQVLAIVDGENTKFGAPVVEGAKVDATVVKNGKGKKIRIFKYTPKKGYRKRQGHRQPYTKVEIGKISF